MSGSGSPPTMPPRVNDVALLPNVPFPRKDPRMIEQLVTRFEAARLDLRQRQLRRQEEAAIARLGEKTLVDGSELKGRLASLASEAAAVRGRLQVMVRGTSQPAPRQRIEALE